MNPAPIALNYTVDDKSIVEVENVHGCIRLTAKQDILVASQSFFMLPTGMRVSSKCLLLLAQGDHDDGSGLFPLLLSNNTVQLYGWRSELKLHFWNPNHDIYIISEGDEIATGFAAHYSDVRLKEISKDAAG